MYKQSKNHDIKVRVSLEEFERIKKKSELAGMKPSPYLRYLGLHTTLQMVIKE